MRIKGIFLSGVVLTLLAMSISVVPPALAQGNLTPPPGAPSPTMLSLSQVEPRTPVDAVHTPGDANSLFIINHPGSYYLTANLVPTNSQYAISIETNDVTLDLSGFTVTGISNSSINGSGIYVPNPQIDLTIRNGVVSDWPIVGIYAFFTSNCQFEHLRLYNDQQTGIYAGTNCVFLDCVAQGDGTGILGGNNCNVTLCNFVANDGQGLELGDNSLITSCAAQNNFATGIFVGNGCVIRDCTSVTNKNVAGIVGGNNCTLSGCTVLSNHGFGITLGLTCVVDGCTVDSNTGVGISSAGSASGLYGLIIKNCSVCQNSLDGIDSGSGSLVEDCAILGNATNGVSVADHSSITGCIVKDSGADGIVVPSSCVVANNTVMGNKGVGIHAANTGGNGYANRIDGNHVRDNGAGIKLDLSSASNVVVRNTAGNNAAGNYIVGTGNAVGTIVSDPTSTTANAWCNFQN
jgi:parallel beta-helix repeat protein